jgi:1-acyl-sn-glycerol-3-phosphate acyltransferase
MIKSLFASRWQIFNEPLKELHLGQRWLLRFFILLWGHLVRVENRGNIDILKAVKGPLIFAFNHNCSYEAILVPTYLIYLRQGKKISFVIDWMYGRLPLLGWLFKQIDPIYVYNKPTRFKFLDHSRPIKKQSTVLECIKYLNLNKSIGIFPEGTRNRSPYELKRGKNGIGHIVLESGAPVLPVGIDFPTRLKKHKIPKFGSLILRIGEKLEFPEERGILSQLKQRSNINSRYKKKAVNFLSSKVTFMVMSSLSELSGKEYPFSSPVLPGDIKMLFNQV